MADLIPFVCTLCHEKFDIRPERVVAAGAGNILCPVDQHPLTRCEDGA